MKIGTLGSKPIVLGTLGLIGVSTYLGTKTLNSPNSEALSHENTKREVSDQLIFFSPESQQGEGSADYNDYDIGSGETEDNSFWATLIENGEMSNLLPEDGFQFKKAGKGQKGKGPGRAAKREKNKKARWERKQNQKNSNRPEKWLSLSRKSLQRAEKRLKEMWTAQASDWVSINQRSWEFESFQPKEVVDDLAMLPDEHVGHVGHEDIAPAVAELLDVGQCKEWNGSERPINMFFAVQNTVPLHADNKRSDFGLVMQFVADMVSAIDIRGNKAKIYEYNEQETIQGPQFVAAGGNGRKNWKSRQNKQIRRALSSRPTLARPKIKPIIEHLNNEMDNDDTTIMSGKTNVVFLFITNIPEDLDSIDEGYLESEINELNKKAFVVVVFIHPQSNDTLRTIPYRIVPKQWTHGLRDNEFAQRILVDKFDDLSSGKNKALIGSIKNMLCLVDERIQCRLANRPWHDPARALQMRSSPQIDSCCGHEISSKAYDSRFKTCCRDGTIKSWLPSGQNPCDSSNQV